MSTTETHKRLVLTGKGQVSLWSFEEKKLVPFWNQNLAVMTITIKNPTRFTFTKKDEMK